EHHVERPAALLYLRRPSGASARVTCCQMSDERGAAQRDLVSVPQSPIDRMSLSARPDCFQSRNVLLHDDDLGPRQLLDQRIAFLVIPMRVRAEQNPNVCEFETELRH